MAKINGEAIIDNATDKWAYIIYHDDGKVILKSEAEFNCQVEAENELVAILQKFTEDLALGKIK